MWTKVGRAAVEAYYRAKAVMPDDDEGWMIVVPRPKQPVVGNRVGKPVTLD